MKDNVWFTFVFMVHLSTCRDAGPKCFDCTRIPFPRDCDHVTQCGVHEVCHTKQIVSHSGHVFYETGCLDSARCLSYNSKRLVSNGTRRTTDDESGDIIACSECCHGDYCNSQGCGTQPLLPYPEARGPLCFNCQKGTVLPEDCETVVACGSDKHCAIESIVGIGGDRLYKTGCKACGDIGDIIVGKRETSCSGCCKTDFCNNDCSPVSSMVTTIPASSLTPTKQTTFSTTLELTQQTTKRTILTTSPAVTSVHSRTVSVTSPITYTKEMQCLHFGYEYLKSFHHCVKPYKNRRLTWQQARDRCIQDGGDLLVFHNKPEESLFESWLLNMTGTMSRYWVGASDIGHEGKWFWVDSTAVDTKLYFHPGEPNDAGYPEGFHENCAAATYFADEYHRILLNDDNCTLPSNFLCEVNLTGRCRDGSYTYVPVLNMCFKIYSTPLTWQQARGMCQSEHADLAQPDTLEKIKFFDKYLKTLGAGIHRYWVGGKQSQSDPHMFIWQTSKQTIAPDLWHAGEPSTAGEQCAVLHWYDRQDLDGLFRLNDVVCNLSYAFICQYK